MKTKNPKKQRNKLIGLTSIGLEIGLIMYLNIKIGKWLDKKYSGDFQTFTMTFSILGFILAMYYLIKKLQRLNN